MTGLIIAVIGVIVLYGGPCALVYLLGRRTGYELGWRDATRTTPVRNGGDFGLFGFGGQGNNR